MAVSEALRDFWNVFAQACGGAEEARFYEAFAFGDSPALADELAALVLQGRKRATPGRCGPTRLKPSRCPGPVA